MDEYLADLYGTNNVEDESIEKLAAADMLVKLAAENGIDLDDLSDDEVGELLSEVEKTASETEPELEAAEAEAMDKLAEADFLGRAMAHAYVNELGEIEKDAGKAGKAYGAVKGALGRAGKAAGEWTGISGMRQSHKAMKGSASDASKLKGAIKGLKAKGDKATPSMKSLGKEYGKSMKDAADYKQLRKEYGKQIAKRVVAPAAGLAAAGGIASAAMDKKSSDEQFEIAAQNRAFEMLADAGYDVEKIAAANMEQAVDERALEMLTEAGYPVE